VTGDQDLRSRGVLQWAMLIIGFSLVAWVVLREALLLFSGEVTTIIQNWPLLFIGIIFFVGGLSCWLYPKSEQDEDGAPNDNTEWREP